MSIVERVLELNLNYKLGIAVFVFTIATTSLG